MFGKSLVWWAVILLLAWIIYVHFIRKVPVKRS